MRTQTKSISLDRLPVGERAKVLSLSLEGAMRRRFMDLGLVPGTIIEAVRVSPSGDPKAYRVRGSVIGIRKSDAGKIQVVPMKGVS